MQKLLVIIIYIIFCLPSFGSEMDENSESEVDKSFLKDSATINYFLWGGRILYVRNKDSKIFDTSPKKWAKNITSPEINDGDNFATNYIYHPYFGALYYQVYRDLGYEKSDAYLGTILQSSLWEFTIEGTVEKPSVIDLIVTPGLGIPLGIYFENLNKELSKSDSFFKKTLSYVINPARLFMSEGDLGIINPLSGQFMIYKPFKYRDSTIDNSPISLSGISVNTYFFDVKQYRGGGADIMYMVDASFTDNSKETNISLRFPWAGAYDGNDKEYNVVDNGFEVGNFSLLISKLLSSKEDVHIGADLGINFPTTTIWGDKKDRLEKLYSNSLILKDVLHDSSVLSPKFYVANNYFRFGAGSELFFNAKDYSNESKEFFAIYDARFNVFKSKSKKYSLDFDLKAIDKLTENNSGIDTFMQVIFKFVGNLNLGISFIKPLNGDAAKYIHNGIKVNLKVPLY